MMPRDASGQASEQMLPFLKNGGHSGIHILEKNPRTHFPDEI